MTITPPTTKQEYCSRTNAQEPTILNLPVAPWACARLRFAQTQDLVRAALPSGALAWLEENYKHGTVIEAINMKGPGDPLIGINETLETMHLIKQKYPHIKLHLTTLGIHGAKYAQELIKNGLTQVTILVDAVEPEIAKKIYAWIRPGRKTIPLPEAVDLLIAEQQKAIQTFKDTGCEINISTTVYPGYNDTHIKKIAQTVASLGADSMSLVPYRPCPDPQDEAPIAPNKEIMTDLKNQAGQYITILTNQEKNESGIGREHTSNSDNCNIQNALIPHPSKEKPNVAVASITGMEVDLHLGQAYKFLIYGPREDGLACLLETRPAPKAGSGDSRWQDLAESLHDCFAILTSGAGSNPRKILAESGTNVLITEDDIAGVVDVLYGGGKKKSANAQLM